MKSTLSEAGDEEADGQVVKPPVVTDPRGDRSGLGRHDGGALDGAPRDQGSARAAAINSQSVGSVVGGRS